MADVDLIFKSFYSQYDYHLIQTMYKNLGSQMYLPDLYKSVPFAVEIRMKNDVFAMQLNTDSIVSMELMTLIGYIFENYSAKKNCVWTKNEKHIKNFFSETIQLFKTFGGKIKFSLDDESIRKITAIMTHESDTKEFDYLCKNFSLLENMNWSEYRECIDTKIKKEESDNHIETVTCMDLPLDWENLYASDERARGVHAQSVSDGLIYSLNNIGKVDIEYISEITGESYKSVINALKGAIYQNPDTWEECFYKGWETADEYLSGMVRRKLRRAKEENEKYNGYFRDNIAALESVLPKTASSDNIYVTLGSPWVPEDIIAEFITHILGRDCAPEQITHDEESGIWRIDKKSAYKGGVKSTNTYGTQRMGAIYIIERTLNMKSVYVADEVACPTAKSGKKRVVNKEETVMALEKQKKIISKFQDWIWKDSDRKQRLEHIYDEKYGSNIIRRYDGSFLQFPDMNKNISLYDYQKNAVTRIMFSPNTLLAHEVGSGKTYIMIAAGMEMRRTGISKKNLYVVPNNLVGQWKKIFLDMYPDSKLLCVDPLSFTKNKREAVLQKIRDDDFDGIIMAYSSFEMISLSREYLENNIKTQIENLEKNIEDSSKSVLNAKRKKSQLQEALKELEYSLNNIYDTIYFDELGINTMFVDEAHNFKNVPIETQINRVLGISKNGSEKCKNMLDKVKAVQKNNDGRGVVFATGTPITNSLTDIFVMQKYLQSGMLSLIDLQSFDSWIGMFAEKTSEFEVDIDTNNFRMATRFSKYHNLPELSALLAAIADFHTLDKTNGIPDFDGYKDILVSKTYELKQYLDTISRRAEDIRQGLVDKKTDNMLKLTTDGRKAALDLRLVDTQAIFSYQSKISFCAENVFNIYMKTMPEKSVQIIFCDVSTPKAGFNIYDEMKRLLMCMGVDSKSIAFIHDASTEKQRLELFEKTQTGKIRVLIGSTFKLGLGVNIQNKLIALHHLDVPWRPADMIQREGRILRKGNENKKIEIYRYITEGSFDAYSWQLLETKQKMITSLLKGNVDIRECQEIDNTVLNYAEIKAIAIGNPLLKKRVETANELSKTLTMQRHLQEERLMLQNELLEIPQKLEYQNRLIESCRSDIEYYQNNVREYTKEERKEIREKIFNAVSVNEYVIKEKMLLEYQGFKIILPSNIKKLKPFIYIKRRGKYYIELGLAEKGTLARIDNFLNGMSEHLKKLMESRQNLIKRKADINTELAKKYDYKDIIKGLRSTIKKLDKKLGVKENE